MDERGKKSIIAVMIVIGIAAGLAWAGSQEGVIAFGMPLFSLCVAIAFVIQWAAFIPAYIKKTEKFFDLTGSLTFISVTLFAVFSSPWPDARAILLAGMVTIWALRLGSFLYRRIHAAGEDRRFREIKTSFGRFLLTWTLQGLWVSFSLAAALAAITSTTRATLGAFAAAGFLVWALGFGIEVTADWQKSKFKANPNNKDKFINSGLWSWSRHPNYFGEIILWIGIAIVTLPVLTGWQWLTLISPVFIYLLLTRISGVSDAGSQGG